MKKTALFISSLALLLGGCADTSSPTDESFSSGSEWSSVEEGASSTISSTTESSSLGETFSSLENSSSLNERNSSSSAAISSGALSSESSDPYEAYRITCVQKINAYRATEGLSPLERWSEAEECADGQAESDAGTGKAHSAFGRCHEGAQNECPGWGSFSQVLNGCLQMMWDEGPGEPYKEHGHYLNMVSLSYTEVACGFFETSNGKVWHVHDFR